MSLHLCQDYLREQSAAGMNAGHFAKVGRVGWRLGSPGQQVGLRVKGLDGGPQAEVCGDKEVVLVPRKIPHTERLQESKQP